MATACKDVMSGRMPCRVAAKANFSPGGMAAAALKPLKDLLSHQKPPPSASTQAALQEPAAKAVPNIHEVAGQGNAEAVKAILSEHGSAALVSRDSEGRTPLHFAAISSNEALVLQVLESGAAVDACDNHAKTPLHWAVAAGDVRVASCLLDAGADINAQFFSGETALHVAVFLEQRDTAAFLLSHGASPHSVDREGRTPLHTASSVGDVSCMRLLLAAGAKPCQLDRLARVALHCACAAGKEGAVRILLENSDCTETYDSRGVTPLYLAAFKGHEGCVSALLEQRKANIEAIEVKRGTTALHAAAARGFAPVVKLLLSKGANWQALTRHGERAMDLARAEGHTEVVQLLQLAPPPPRSPSRSPSGSPNSSLKRRNNLIPGLGAPDQPTPPVLNDLLSPQKKQR